MMYKLSETPVYVSFFMLASLMEGFFGVRVKRVLKRDLQMVLDPQLNHGVVRVLFAEKSIAIVTTEKPARRR